MRGRRDKSGPREEAQDDVVYGRWPVREAIQAGRASKVFIANGLKDGPMQEIATMARHKGLACSWVDRNRLEQMAGENNQGVVATVIPLQFASIDAIWAAALREKTQGPRVLFLDGIMDPQNLGAILRSAYFFGVPGVIIPKWRAASISGAVVKASAGAAQYIPVAQVANLPTAMEAAKDKGIWLVGADMGGMDAKKADIPRPFGLVMGSEGEGLHQLVSKKCDLIVGIQRRAQKSGVDSLNVGAATAVLLHQFS